jgi:hypothetical protein
MECKVAQVELALALGQAGERGGIASGLERSRKLRRG